MYATVNRSGSRENSALWERDSVLEGKQQLGHFVFPPATETAQKGKKIRKQVSVIFSSTDRFSHSVWAPILVGYDISFKYINER